VVGHRTFHVETALYFCGCRSSSRQYSGNCRAVSRLVVLIRLDSDRGRLQHGLRRRSLDTIEILGFGPIRPAKCGNFTAAPPNRRSTGPVQPEFPWRTERARAGPVSEANGTSRELALPVLAPSEARCVASATTIRASAARCGCSSADISLSERERSEGFQLSLTSAVAVTRFPASERPEEFQRATSSIVESLPTRTNAVPVTIARVQATDTLAGYIRRLPQ
jgi:hypothetical protein